MNSHQKADAVIAMMSSSLMSNLAVSEAITSIRMLAQKAHAFDLMCLDMERTRKHVGNRRVLVSDTSNIHRLSTSHTEIEYRDIPLYEWKFHSETAGPVADRLFALAARKDTPNQCDGCCVKAPINKHGNHDYPDGSKIACTRKRYE